MVPPKEPPGLFFDLYDEWGIERHIALLPMSREAGAYGALSWCRVSDWGRTNGGTLQDISSAALSYFFGRTKSLRLSGSEPRGGQQPCAALPLI